MQDGVHALTLLLLAAFGPATPVPVDTARKPSAVVQDGTAPLARSHSSIGREMPSGAESLPGRSSSFRHAGRSE
jgi:hypothetical protein